MLLLNCVVAVLLLGVASAQLISCGQNAQSCSIYTESCTDGRCLCRPDFYGPTCNENFHVARPDLFYGLFSMHLVTAFLGTALGVFLILYYFCRFVPKAKSQNSQIIGIFMVTLGALFRFLVSTMYLATGPSTVPLHFYQQPNAYQFFLRFFVAVFYPLAIGALTLQVLIWMEFVMAVKSLKPTAHTWVPRLKWVFFPALAFLLIFVTVIQGLLVADAGVPAVLFVYRLVLAVYIALLLILAVVFATRLFLILRSSRKLVADSKLSSRARNSRANLTRMVLISCGFTLAGLVLAILFIVLPVDRDVTYYYPFYFVLRLVEMGLVLSLLVTALAMMRNRIAYSTGSGMRETTDASGQGTGNYELRDSTTEGYASDTAMLGKNLKRSGTASRSGSSSRVGSMREQQPLMDYSGFGSTVDDSEENPVGSRSGTMVLGGGSGLLDEDDRAAGSYEFERGELVWAQYRMDGLWYAGRIDSIGSAGLQVEYLDYDLSDTLPVQSVCPDHQAMLTGERLHGVKAFDSRPSAELLRSAGALQPDTFGLVRLRGKAARKPNHSSLLLKRGSLSASGDQ